MKTILLLLVAVCALAQTKPDPTQLNWPSSTQPMILMVTVDGPVFVKIDLATMIYDPVNKTISAKPLPDIIVSDELLKPTTTGVWKTAAGCIPWVVRKNGVVQTYVADPPRLPDFDWTSKDLAGSTLTWRPTSLPVATDTVIVTCARNVPEERLTAPAPAVAK